MNNEDDIFYKELKEIKYYLSLQPDKKVKSSIIKEPYKSYFVKSYRALKKKLK